MRFPVVFCTLAVSLGGFAAQNLNHVRFGADAFNQAVAVDSMNTAVFSPLSFELDSVALSDAFDPITKAHFAETLGVLSDFEGVYGRIVGRMRGAAESNNFSFVSARAICLPDMRMASVAYRREIQDMFSAEICPATPKEGAECWLRNMMDGDMEDFDIPLGAVASGRYAFYDLASVKFSWQEPFPTSNTRNVAFVSEDGHRRDVEAMCDIRNADLWENRRYSMVRLPLADGAWFFALVPNGRHTLAEIRSEFSSTRVDDLLSVMNSVTVSGVSHGPVVIVMPKMDVTSTVDLVGVFGHFQFPLKGFSRLDGEMRPALAKQRVRFRLDEQGLDAEPLVEKPAENMIHADANTKRFLLNRPFLFFVVHEPTGTVPLAGQYTGR